MAIPLASPRDIEEIAAVAAMVAACLKLVVKRVDVGQTPADIARHTADVLDHAGLESVLLGYQGPTNRNRAFPAVAMVWANDEPSDAPPSSRPFENGDIVTIDIAARLKASGPQGWITDVSAGTVVGPQLTLVGFDEPSANTQDPQPNAKPPTDRGPALLRAAHAVTAATIDAMIPGGLWSVAAAASRGAAQRAGVHILPGFAGHGIGKTLHQPPALSYRTTERELRLWPGMIVTVEPVVVELPAADPKRNKPWTCSVEHTVAITEQGVRVLTA